MRRLIEDAKLLRVLKVIEDELGAIEKELERKGAEKSMPQEMAALFTGDISLHEGQWVFLREDYSDERLFHELMHVSLWIEGWPSYRITKQNLERQEKWRELEERAELAAKILQHPPIWKRGKQYGYSEEVKWNKQIVVDVETKVWERFPTGEYLIAGQALYLAHAMLSPAAEETKSFLAHQAQAHLPKAHEVTKGVFRVLEQLDKFLPGSFHVALMKVCEATGMPIDIHLRDPLDRSPRHDFFQERIEPILR